MKVNHGIKNMPKVERPILSRYPKGFGRGTREAETVSYGTHL